MKWFAAGWASLLELSVLLLVHQANAKYTHDLNVLSEIAKDPDALAESTSAAEDFMGRVQSGEYQKIGSILGHLVDAEAAGDEDLRAAFPALLFEAETGQVKVEVVFRMRPGDNENKQYLPDEFANIGFTEDVCIRNVCNGWAEISNLVTQSNHQETLFIKPVVHMEEMPAVVEPQDDNNDRRTGSVTSEGDFTMRSAEARPAFNVAGGGVTIGVLSSSFDCILSESIRRYSNDLLSGDLPTGITVIRDFQDAACTDQGRALLQIINDVAPDAKLMFHTASGGSNVLIQGIQRLSRAGCDIIVSGTAYISEPWFQDGTIAQAAETAIDSLGVAFFPAAGNRGRAAWHADDGFVSSGFQIMGGVAHNFGSSFNVDPIQNVEMLPGTYLLGLQWDQPFASVTGSAACESNVDLHITDVNGNPLLSSTDNNIGGDAFELLAFSVSQPIEVGIVVTLVGGIPPWYMKWFLFSGPEFEEVEYDILSSTIVGHRNSAGGAAVGTVRFDMTPAFGVSPPIQRPFSGAGGTPIFLDRLGNRLDSAEIRRQPKFMGTDGTLNTFFGRNQRHDGTAAGAAHVAAAASLLKQGEPEITPSRIFQTLGDTAVDMDDQATPVADFGFDFGTGDGYVDAFLALSTIVPTPSPTPVPTQSPTINPTTLAPSMSPTQKFKICFSEESTVQVQGKGTVPMKDLQVNDNVFVGSEGVKPIYQPVYSFGHHDTNSLTEYLRIHTNSTSNKDALEISASHLLFVNGQDYPVTADSIQEGDVLLEKAIDAPTSLVRVTKVESITRNGAYMPLTKDGSIVVNQIQASTYVSILDDAPTVIQWYLNVLASEDRLIHWWLAPYRMVCLGLSSNLCKEDYNEEGIAYWLAIGHYLATEGDSWHARPWVQLLGMVVFGLFMAGCMVLETLLSLAVGAPLGLLCVGCVAIALSTLSLAACRKEQEKVGKVKDA